MPLPQLTLASGSPQRLRLLTDAGFAFDVVIPHESAECGICSTGGPAALVAELAQRKAADVASQLANRNPSEPAPRLLIACDTVAECGGAILGKPKDVDHARNMLERLRGTTHRVYSGLCLWPYNSDPSGVPETCIVTTELRMDDISDDQLDEYLASELWQGKAGAFGYQDRTNWLHICQGSESNVIGLPMEQLTEMLAARGYTLGST
ncbi:MAG: septum formation protein Maf [Planctomycetes bacterium]|nr:septum formation protein Maf [Planctomycetota bacterium]